MADETTAAPRSRRALLTGAAATAAALAASAALPLGVSAADPDDVVKGEDNATTATTSITNGTADSNAFEGAAAGTGFGVQGSSTGGAGVVGWSVEAPDAECAPEDFGVHGRVRLLPGRRRLRPRDGRVGREPRLRRVRRGAWYRRCRRAAGVYGYGDHGVVGESASTSAGVLAIGQSATDVALEVQGKVKFSRSGRATLGAGKSSIKVTLAGTTTSSRVFAVLHSNRTGRWVQSVVPTTGSFTIYLNGTVTSSTYIAWFVIN